MNDISALVKEAPESSLVPFAMCGYSEETAVYKPGTDPHQTLNLPAP